MFLTPDRYDAVTGFLRGVGVYVFLLLLLLLNVANIPLLHEGMTRPAFLLTGIYFWSLTRPSFLPLPLVFAFGFLFDLLSGGAVGLHTLVFLAVAIIVRGQRRFLLGQSWQVVWVGFVVAALLAQLAGGVVHLLSTQSLPSLLPFVAQIAVSALAYPILLFPMMFLNRVSSQ
jgi:rod shape-determining protein MreD